MSDLSDVPSDAPFDPMFPDGDPTANVPPSAMRPDVGDVPSDQWRERATIAKDALELDFQRRKVRTLQAEVERLHEALEWIRHQCGAATADDALRAMNEAYDAANAALSDSHG